MENQSTVQDVAQKITVLDAIMWIKAAIQDIKASTVSNCFKKCGISISQGEEIVVDVDPPVDLHDELQEMINHSWGTFSVNDYIEIDQSLESESTSLALADLIPVAEEEDDQESESEEQPQIISSSKARQCINEIEQYFLQIKDTQGFELAANLKIRHQNFQSKQRKTQKCITEYFS